MGRFRAVVACFALALAGCGVFVPFANKASNLESLRVGMPQAEVVEAIGSPDAVRSEGGNRIVWRRDLYRSPGSAAAGSFFFGFFSLTLTWWLVPEWFADTHTLEFEDGQLVRWS